MFKRAELQVLKKRVLESRKFIQVIMGPRQVGKTTMLGQLLKEIKIPYLFESADAVLAGSPDWLNAIWEAARLKMRTLKYKEFLLVIDEIQKIPNWSEMIKRSWDEDSRKGINLKLVLLGSSRLLLQQGLTESLAGRFETIYMTHWSLEEMESAFGIDAERYAWYGGYPGSAQLINDEGRWKKYIRDALIETSISKDILMLTRVDKPALMKNLFELGCLYSGQVLSFTKMLGQLQDAGNTTTLSHYLELLNTAGLLGEIQKYAVTGVRRRASSPKFQVHNNALISAQINDKFEDVINDHEQWGRIIESAIGVHLLNNSLRSGFSVFYWRERNEEVDFVIEMGHKLVAIEVKSSQYRTSKGMTAFKQRFKPTKSYIISNDSLSWQEFLRINPVKLF